jgi:hypothetical protein
VVDAGAGVEAGGGGVGTGTGVVAGTGGVGAGAAVAVGGGGWLSRSLTHVFTVIYDSDESFKFKRKDNAIIG